MDRRAISVGAVNRFFTVVKKASNSGDPITTGTVNYFLKAITGGNAGKWWKDSNQTWDASETANAMAHQADGHWSIALAATPFADSIVYLEYVKESGNLHIPQSRELVGKNQPSISTAGNAKADVELIKTRAVTDVGNGQTVYLSPDAYNKVAPATPANVTDAQAAIIAALPVAPDNAGITAAANAAAAAADKADGAKAAAENAEGAASSAAGEAAGARDAALAAAENAQAAKDSADLANRVAPATPANVTDAQAAIINALPEAPDNAGIAAAYAAADHAAEDAAGARAAAIVIEGRLTDDRAANLDNLDLPISDVEAAVVEATMSDRAADTVTLTTGMAIGGSVLKTHTHDGMFYTTAPVTPAVGGFGLNEYFEFNVSAAQTAPEFHFWGWFNASPPGTRIARFAAWHWVNGTWDFVSTGATDLAHGTSEVERILEINVGHRSETGVVRLRITSESETTTDRLYVDQIVLHVSAATATPGQIAEAVWASTTRTLTSFGTLVAEAAAAVLASMQGVGTYLARLFGLVENVDGDRFKAKALEEAPAAEVTLTPEQIAAMAAAIAAVAATPAQVDAVTTAITTILTALLARLTGAVIRVDGETARSGRFRITEGDDRTGARAVTITVENWGGVSLDGATGRFTACTTKKFMASGVIVADLDVAVTGIVQVGTTVTVTLALAAEDTEGLSTVPPDGSPNYAWQLEALVDEKPVTFASGLFTLERDIPSAP